MKSIGWGIFLGCCLSTVPGWAQPADDGWELVYADDFERDEVGPAWVVLGGQDKGLSIIDGELVGDGTHSRILFAHPVPGDQKVVFEARWIEGTGRSVTQHAALLKASTWNGAYAGVMLVHGRGANSMNSLEMFGRRVAHNDGPLPEPGVKYAFEGTIEGTHASLKRNDELILEGELAYALDGPDTDRVLFYANGRRIRFDSIRIYRKPRDTRIVRSVCTVPWTVGPDGLPAFGGPDPDGRIASVLALYRAGDPAGALAAAEAVPEAKQKLDALLVLAAQPTYDPFRAVLRAIQAHLVKHPELEPAQPEGALSLAQAAKLGVLVASRSVTGYGNALYLLPRLDPSHVLYAPLLYQHGRQVLMGEGVRSSELLATRGRMMFENLVLHDPTIDLYRMYLGAKIPWGQQYTAGQAGAPAWARLVREMHGRLLHVIDWWFRVRQAPDGQLGGGWGDDVEALRGWAPVLLLSDAAPDARAGLRRLVDGAWKKAEGGLELGYSKRLWDVEHSAEPTADTQPLMLAFEPNDPIYAARNRLLLGLVTNQWTVLRPEGRYFRNVTISATDIDKSPDLRASVPYHTRAIKGLTWLAWSGQDADVETVWLQFADAWAEATLREADGKLTGVVPAAIDPADGSLGAGRGTWYRPNLMWSYYNWGRGVHAHVFGLLAAAFLETHDSRYIEPIARAVEQALAYPGREGWTPAEPDASQGEVPSPVYQRYMLNQWHRSGFFAPYLLAYRNGTGDGRFDAWLADVAAYPECSPLVRYQVTGDLEVLVAGLEVGLESLLRYNLPMLTTEVQATDGIKTWPGPDLLYPLVSGALTTWGDSFWPTHIATWSPPTSDWAAVTRRTGPRTVDIRFWNFDAADAAFGLKLWNLPAGDYAVAVEPVSGENGTTQAITVEGLVTPVELAVPVGQEYRIRIRKDSDSALR